MFVILLTYTAPADAVDQHLSAHREYLQRQYDAGHFLVSGRRNPRIGGVILAQAASREALEAIVVQDPFITQGVASYEIIEFVAAMAAPAFAAFLNA